MTSMGQIINSHTVRFERMLPGSIDQVWDAFTTPSGLSSWLYADTVIDAQERGRIDLKFRTPDPENNQIYNVRGAISEYQPKRAFAYAWFENSSDVSSHVRFEFEPHGDETLLVLTHSYLSPAFMVKVGAGWHAHLDALAAILKGEQPIDFLPEFNRLFNVYGTIIATSVVIVAASPAVASPTDDAQKALAQHRQQLLTKYDRVWKDADDIKYKLDTLKKSSNPDVSSALKVLERELDSKYDDLRDVEHDIKDLDKALIVAK